MEETIDGAAQTLADIRAYKNPRESWFEKVIELADTPLDVAGNAAFESAVGDKLENVVVKVVEKLNDAASWTVRREAILDDFKKNGHEVDEIEDIDDLDVADVHEVLGGLALKCKAMGAVEGAATGAAGALGIALDIPALVVLSLRAINEYAVYFGFDNELEEERCYALAVLSVASTATDAQRQESLGEITDAARELAGGAAQPLHRKRTPELVKKIAEALVVRLAKGKLAQVVPLVGSAVGGGYNTLFLTEVCKSAHMLYAERWLMRKLGPDVAVDVELDNAKPKG